jgi:serine phosphatase RsbU (regulator of sigma subunit)/catechol 2,3-dioxygenase-like lactoylglutathione lyase family enzyme
MPGAVSDGANDNWLARDPLFHNLGREESDAYPYLRILAIEVFVRDQDRSLEFYQRLLGFRVLADTSEQSWGRWVAVTPPSYGSAVLALVKAPESRLAMIGRRTGVTLVTDDIAAQVKKWSACGVRFVQLPTPVPWGLHATFEDLDGNQFELIQNPQMVAILTDARRALEERAEAERLAVLEIEIARRVQRRLFPQEPPAAKTIAYKGACIQARQVGGDYYDFLELRPNRLGIVVADVSGKGVSGALLMANLQANIRSQYATAIDDLAGFLTNVNRLFYKSSEPSSYSTLFFADYDDSSRKLRYANCGHLSPLLLRAGTQGIEWLHSTCTVVGLFPNWECETAEVEPQPGDTLVLYTDGIVEAARADDEQFGEERLVDVLTANAHLDPDGVIRAVVDAVHEFTGGQQQDDITLVVGRFLP